ncbi:MAG: YCF48-related protein [Chlorobi bacterium]|nr:YCF48-related protein [Chlorobiota bacterium]MCI0714804.1 YCF48-related protein [Chlorobiota bacterium]
MKYKLALFALLFFSTKLCNSQWLELNTGNNIRLNSISAANDFVCWSAGENGVVIRTINGGTNWISVGGGAIGSAIIYNIFAVDSNTALCTTTPSNSTNVYRTSNGGNTWTQVFSQNGGFINAIWMTSATNGFMMGDPVGGRWSLWKTFNGGSSWDSTGLYLNQFPNMAGWVNAMHMVGNSIWFNTNGFTIYYSSNYGNNWVQQFGPDAGSNGSVWFNNLTTGLSSGNLDLRYSTNSGMSWFARTNPSSNGTPVLMGKGSQFWACVFNSPSQIYMTTNNGINWVVEYTPQSGQLSHITASRNGNSGWACKTDGGVVKKDILVAINQISNEILNRYELKQNYPNPFNPKTTIRFSVPKTSRIFLKVYDLLGREVSILVNQFLQPGNYSVNFNGSNIASGIYYYTINADEFIETKKMVLIK